MEFTNESKYITFQNLGLKILGFVNTGVPVQFRPGAPILNKSTTYVDNPLQPEFALKSEKEPISVPTDTKVTQNPWGGF